MPRDMHAERELRGSDLDFGQWILGVGVAISWQVANGTEPPEQDITIC